MNDELLATIKRLVNGGRYRIKIHAVRHIFPKDLGGRHLRKEGGDHEKNRYV